MKLWLTARELADLALPGLPSSKRNINRMADEEGWRARQTARGEPLARQRSGRDGGGGLEYHVTLLPAEARAALSAHAAKLPAPALTTPAMGEGRGSAPNKAPLPAPATPLRVLRRDARLAVLQLADAHLKQNLALGLVAATADFCARWNAGLVPADAWLKEALPQLSPTSLKRWRAQRQAGGFNAVGGTGRAVKQLLDVANGGDIATRIGAYLIKQPFLTAHHVRDLIRADFGDEVTGPDGFEPLPSARSFQRFITAWRQANATLLLAATNPDAYKSRARLTGSNAYAMASHVNALWEIDASPADVLLKGGRHSIYVITDVFSRRVMISVTKTPRAEAALLLLRRAILAWGVPAELRTDNGSDFTSQAFTRALLAVGIAQDVSRPYTPEDKAVVERMIGTLQHRLMPLLPGFIGHSVADRKQIEERRAFAARLGESDENCFCVDLTRDEFQAYLDRWATDDHAHRIHRGLGQTPAEKARSCLVPLRTISNERALDMLLSPIAGGWRIMGKRGIEFDKGWYLAGSILPGARVFCRQHPDDFGKLLCFDDEFGQFIGIAECAERSGASPHAILAAARAERKQIMADGLKEAKALARAIKPREMVEKVLDLKARDAMAAAGNVVEMPKRREAHGSAALSAAADAADFEARLNRPFEVDLDAHFSAPANGNAAGNVRALPESREVRFMRFKALTERVAAGEELSADEAYWLGGYAKSPEYLALKRMEEDFGGQAAE